MRTYGNVHSSGSDLPSLDNCLLSDLRKKLRHAGLRATRQRVSLGWLLFRKGHRHVSAEMLYEEAVCARLKVSLATVYNTLHQFTKVGLLRQLAVDWSKSYFDTDTRSHYHLLIEGENRLIDIPDENIVCTLIAPLKGMEIAGIEVLVRGRSKGDQPGPDRSTLQANI
jgi:Fur family iron response transcriptional regulator